MGIYDSIIKDGLSNSAIDFSEIDFKKFKLQLQSQSQQKPSRELSAGREQSTTATTKPRITYSMYDSINL